jgi:hypothetical protein
MEKTDLNSMEGNIYKENNIYKNDKTGNLHLVISNNIKDNYLNDESRLIIHRDLNDKNNYSYLVDYEEFFDMEYTFFSTYDDWVNRNDELTNEMLNDSSIIEGLELKSKVLNEREKILKEKITNIMNTIHEWSIELDELFPEYTYEN